MSAALIGFVLLVDNELISLGLFDKAMGKRPRKPDAK